MTDITPQQGAELGTDAMTLMLNLMQRNRNESETIRASLYESVQRDLDEANATIRRIRGNVMVVLSRPHTDAMVADALYARREYEGDGAP